MTWIIFVQPDGTEVTVDASESESVMEAALGADIDGIIAECGGNAMCATCHVYVDFADDLPLHELSGTEDAMLDSTGSPRRSNSRLSCQIPVSPSLEMTRFAVPESQV